MTAIYVLGSVWVVCLIAGAMLGSMRGNTAFGFLWPFFLGPLGLVMSWYLLKDDAPRTTPQTHA